MRFVILTIALLSSAALAQDAGQIAHEQILLSQQIQQQQIQQQTQQQLNQQILNDQLNQANLGSYTMGALRPSLTQEPGPSPGTVLIHMKDRSRGAIIFYTTDGWTPTASSARYTGPFVLDRTTNVRAIALAPGSLRSSVLVTPIVVATSAASSTLNAAAPVNVPALIPGMTIPLLFTGSVVSHGLQVGDKVPVALAQEISVNGKIVAHRLAPVLATVLQVDRHGLAGAPGSITFAVHSVTLDDGTIVPLSGTKTMEGETRTRAAQSVEFVPLIGLGGVFIRGGEAVIPMGATLTAQIAAQEVSSTH